MTGTPDSTTRIVIIDQSAVRRAMLEEGLREAGYDEIVHLTETDRLHGAHRARSIPM